MPILDRRRGDSLTTSHDHWEGTLGYFARLLVVGLNNVVLFGGQRPSWTCNVLSLEKLDLVSLDVANKLAALRGNWSNQVRQIPCSTVGGYFPTLLVGLTEPSLSFISWIMTNVSPLTVTSFISEGRPIRATTSGRLAVGLALHNSETLPEVVGFLPG